MRIVRAHRAGGPEVLVAEDVDDPVAGPGELLVEVAAAGVTWPVVRATYTLSTLPSAPAGEVAGRIVAVGSDVTEFVVGQRVAALAFSGAYAERAVVGAAMAVAVPDGVDDVTAVALVRSGQVALGGLRAGGLSAETPSVLVTAAAGAVGSLAVQIARAVGVPRIVAASSSAEKAAFLRELGATETVTYDEEWGEPVALALDSVGDDEQGRVVEALAPLGLLVSISGSGASVDVNALRMHGRGVIGFAMPHLVRHRPETYRRHADELWELARSGRVVPRIDGPHPLADAAAAHQRMLERRNLGKLVLTP